MVESLWSSTHDCSDELTRSILDSMEMLLLLRARRDSTPVLDLVICSFLPDEMGWMREELVSLTYSRRVDAWMGAFLDDVPTKCLPTGFCVVHWKRTPNRGRPALCFSFHLLFCLLLVGSGSGLSLGLLSWHRKRNICFKIKNTKSNVLEHFSEKIKSLKTFLCNIF